MEEEATPLILTDDVAEAMALAYAEVSDESLCGFGIRPLCGKWTAAHVGVAQDAWQAYAVHQDQKDWCWRYGFNTTARFNISLYGREGALTCCRYWVSKMACWFRVWVLAGASVPFLYEPRHFAEFIEPPAFTALCVAEPEPRAQARFNELRALRPAGNGVR